MELLEKDEEIFVDYHCDADGSNAIATVYKSVGSQWKLVNDIHGNAAKELYSALVSRK